LLLLSLLLLLLLLLLQAWRRSEPQGLCRQGPGVAT